MLPRNTSSVNIESTGKSKQLYNLCDKLLEVQIFLHFIVLILICFQLIMPGVNYAINGCSSSRATPGALGWRKKFIAVITEEKVIDDKLKRKIRNQTLYTCRLFLLTCIYQYISNWSKVF